VGSRAQNFGTRGEAEMAAKPMRVQGLAGVYRQYGEVDKADELETRAFEQQRSLAQEKRAQAQFDQQQKLGELTLKDRERAAESQRKIDDLNAWRAENPNATVQEIKDAARSQFKLDDDQLLKVTSTITGLEENDLKQFQAEVKNTIKGKNLDGLVNIFNTDDRFDPTTSIKTTRGKDGSVSLSFVGQDGKTISTEKFSSEAKATAYLNKQAVEPDTVAEWLLGIRKTEAAIAASEAGAFKDTQLGLTAGREKAPRPVTIAELNTMAKGMIDSGMEDPDAPGKPLTYMKAMAIARAEAAGIPYKSAADRLIDAMVANAADASKKTGSPATATSGAAPRATPGLTREQVGQAVTQQQTGVQAETRVRRAAITAFEQDPRVRQAYDAVRQLRRSGEAVRANNLENQINAQRERFITERVGGGR